MTYNVVAIEVRDIVEHLRRDARCFRGTGTNPSNLQLWESRSDRQAELWCYAADLMASAADLLEERIDQVKPRRIRLKKEVVKQARVKLLRKP